MTANNPSDPRHAYANAAITALQGCGKFSSCQPAYIAGGHALQPTSHLLIHSASMSYSAFFAKSMWQKHGLLEKSPIFAASKP